MTSAILDTNIVVDLLAQHQPAVVWFTGLRRQRIAITPIVWMETVEGARNSAERARLIRFLRQFYMEHPTPDDNNWAILQFGRFYLSHQIDLEDIMIASVAARLAVPLCTLNLKHYAPLPNVDEQRPY